MVIYTIKLDYIAYFSLHSAAQIFYELVDLYKVWQCPTLEVYPLLLNGPFLDALQSRGTAVFITHLRDALRDTFERAGIVTAIAKEPNGANRSEVERETPGLKRQLI